MQKFPKIGSIRDSIYAATRAARFRGIDQEGVAIVDESAQLPIITYYGTVKLHGTNAGITRYPDGSYEMQSRNSVITPMKDNYGFATEMWSLGKNITLKKLFKPLKKYHNKTITIFGEWAGKGIQSGVAISKVSKQFYIFAITVEEFWGEERTPKYLDMIKYNHVAAMWDGIYNLWDHQRFPVSKVSLAVSDPEQVKGFLEERVQSVEDKCPVADYFGETGTGEGWVWVPIDNNLRSLAFKTKGLKHSDTKSKTPVEIDVEKLNSTNEFLDYVLTEHRLEKGLEYLKSQGVPFYKGSTGLFAKWVREDVVNEQQDTIVASGLTEKEVNKSLSKAAAKWFIEGFG